jgi:hypothetical protein
MNIEITKYFDSLYFDSTGNHITLKPWKGISKVVLAWVLHDAASMAHGYRIASSETLNKLKYYCVGARLHRKQYGNLVLELPDDIDRETIECQCSIRMIACTGDSGVTNVIENWINKPIKDEVIGDLIIEIFKLNLSF